MKKVIILIAVLGIVLMSHAFALAEYVTYYDVFDDIKLILGENTDDAWATGRETAKAAAESMEGFTCQDAGEDEVICVKDHWCGDFRAELYFSEGKLSAVICFMTGSTIDSLNYPAGTQKRVRPADDLVKRLRSAGMIPEGAAEQEGKNIFPGEETTPYSPVFEIGSKTLLQAGFNSKSPTNPKFWVAFIIASDDFSGDISVTAGSAEQNASPVTKLEVTVEPEAVPEENTRVKIFLSKPEGLFNEMLQITVEAPDAGRIRIWNQADTINPLLEISAPYAKHGAISAEILPSTPGTKYFYAAALYNGVWEKSNTVSFVSKLDPDSDPRNVVPAKDESEFFGTWKATALGYSGNGEYVVFPGMIQGSELEITRGQLHYLQLSDKPDPAKFEDGKLYYGPMINFYEMTQGGQMMYCQPDGLVVYYERMDDIPAETE